MLPAKPPLSENLPIDRLIRSVAFYRMKWVPSLRGAAIVLQ